MSTIASWAYTNPVTFWRLSTADIYGQPTYALAYTVLCAFELVDAVSPDNAVPTAEASSGMDTFYFELDPDVAAPTPGWLAALGTFSGSEGPPGDAKRVKSITRYDAAMFGETVPDYKVSAA